ncbi:MAG: ThiF family adenylyltransferase [Chitinophagaceae bacterium]|nr:ThiF family adenylyltransferase [Chitinophagaceae bacterium]
MQQQLINHSPDLKRLRDEGYEIEIKGGYLLSHHIPYVNSKKEVKYGTLVSELTLRDNGKTAKPNNHVICFIGEHPCNKNGCIITGIQHATHNEQLYEGVIINHKFSNKPLNGYPDYYEKIKRYADIISAPAKSLDKLVTEKTFKVISNEDDESVFQYYDTNASRANIQVINSKFKGQKIAIIGLGGTGAYILDLVSKTPVQEIHPYDGDVFLQHNAFRSPGAVSLEQLSKGGLRKAEHHSSVYKNMHKNIMPHDYYVTRENMHELKNYCYVFICLDKNPVRKEIMDFLIGAGIPFIDVGLGVNIAENNLVGTVRVTTGTPGKNDHLGLRVSCEDNENNEYATNIQIADLNCLNAVLAVIKWKKLSGFYQDVKEEHHTTYSINVSQLRNEDTTTSVR